MKVKITIILVSFVFALFFNSARAQWVYIPDPNMVDYLQDNYPTCMNGSLMDTTCNYIVNTPILNLYGFNYIEDLEGIQYFDNITELIIYGTYLSSIPALASSIEKLRIENNIFLNGIEEFPSSLKELEIDDNFSLESIPNFNDSLNKIQITSNNSLANIGAMPDNIDSLIIKANNNLTTLPNLPDSLIYIDCDGNGLYTLPELPEGLIYLSCVSNQINQLPELPSSLEFLNCGINNLVSLPVLPESLKDLQIHENGFSFLPEIPNGVRFINCYLNPISELPVLPDSLTELWCWANNLVSLPSLPNRLTQIACSNNQIVELPELPNSLISMNCSNNNLTSLPIFPSSLRYLDASSNQLTSLPNLLNSLIELDCSYNNLTSLPILTNSLRNLDASSNQLTSLPNLPDSLEILKVPSNQIACFPIFPNSLVILFGISWNAAECLPNYISAMSSQDLQIPLCFEEDIINNPYNCAYTEGIKGKIYVDANFNCSIDATDLNIKNVPVNLMDADNNLISTVYSYANGIYNFNENLGIYTAAVDTANKPYRMLCSAVDSTFTLDAEHPIINGVDFLLNCPLDADFGILSILPTGLIFPGQQHQLNILGGNALQWYNLTNCGNNGTGTVQIVIEGPVSFAGIPSTALYPNEIIGDTFIYNLDDINSVDLEQFQLFLLTDTTAISDDQICITATITSSEADYNLENNQNTFCYPVANSFDPNEKQVYPTSVLPGYEDYFIYTIHFQNTGNAPAISIKILDTLDSNLDLSTFEIINYSHINTTTLSGNLINFKFNNIFLPDSTSDLEGSKGYIQYKIRPFQNLPLGTEIKNTANIYFDYNAPITTNTVNSIFENIVGINTYKNEKILIYPNPSNGIFNLRIPNHTPTVKQITVVNALGDLCWSNTTNSNNLTIDLSKLPRGIYVLRVNDSTSNYIQKIVKE